MPPLIVGDDIIKLFQQKTDVEGGTDQNSVFTVQVIGPITSLNTLVDRIQSDYGRRSYLKINEPLSINIFNACDNPEHSSTNLNGQFVYSQLVIDCLVRMKSTTDNQKELISFLEKEYKDNSSQLAIVREFEENYSYNQALWWYTRETFLYRLLNKAFRVQNFGLLFLFRIVIRDIDQQIKQHRCSSPIRVYRGQLISKEELCHLRNSIGEFISMNSFFSASLDRQLALFYLTDSSQSVDCERVLFDIDADPRPDGVKPFADITPFSSFSLEKEVLITVGAIFRLIDIYTSEGDIWNIRMTMCSDYDHDLKSTFEHMKDQYGCGETSLLSLGHVLEDMGKFDAAEKCFLRLLNDLPPNHKDIAHCYYNLGNVIQEKGDFDSSLEWHYKSLEIKIETLEPDDPSLADSYSSMGCVYDDKKVYDQSLRSYRKALFILRKAYGEDHMKVAECLDSMGLVYNNDNKYSEAITCHQKALDIMKNHLPTNHHKLGLMYTSIGNLYRNLGQYDLALEHYSISLKICNKSLPSDHPNNAWTLKNIGLLHEKMGELQRALCYYEQAAAIYRHALSPTHPDVIKIEQLIQNISSQIRQ